MTLLHLYQRAEQEGVDVDYFPMREDVSFSLPGGLIAMDVDKMRDSKEEKVLLAHELGHIETGSFYNIHSGLDVRGKYERRADKQAIKMLVPKDELDCAVNSGFTELWELADYFGVSEAFMKKAICLYKFGNLDVDSYFGQ